MPTSTQKLPIRYKANQSAAPSDAVLLVPHCCPPCFWNSCHKRLSSCWLLDDDVTILLLLYLINYAALTNPRPCSIEIQNSFQNFENSKITIIADHVLLGVRHHLLDAWRCVPYHVSKRTISAKLIRLSFIWQPATKIWCSMGSCDWRWKLLKQKKHC